MKTFTKTLVGTVATLAMAVGSAAPAAAQDRHRDRDNISTRDVLTGALVIGGIAAVAAAASNDRDRDYRDGDYRYDDYRGGGYRDRNWDGRGSGWYDYRAGQRYGRGNNPERAVQACVNAAERQAQRFGGGRADVTRIRDVDRTRGGFEVTGRIQVSSRYNSNWNGYNRGRDRDNGRFYCDYRNGRVVDIDIDGINRR